MLKKIAWVLVIIGGLIWGLMGLGQLLGQEGWNLVKMILGTWSSLEALVYLLVGISAVIVLVSGRGQSGNSQM